MEFVINVFSAECVIHVYHAEKKISTYVVLSQVLSVVISIFDQQTYDMIIVIVILSYFIQYKIIATESDPQTVLETGFRVNSGDFFFFFLWEGEFLVLQKQQNGLQVPEMG